MRVQRLIQVAVSFGITLLFAGVADGIPNPEAAAETARRGSEVTIRFAITSVQYSQEGDELKIDATGFVKDIIVRQPHGLLVGDDIKIVYGVRDVRQAPGTKRDFEVQRPGLPLRLPTPVLKAGDVADGWFGRHDDGTLFPVAGPDSFEFIGRQETAVLSPGTVSYFSQGDSAIVDELGTYLRLVDLCDASKCDKAPQAEFDVIHDGTYRRHVVTFRDPDFRLTDAVSLGLSDFGARSVAVGVVPSGLWRASQGDIKVPLPKDWADLLLSPTTSYVQAMSLSGEGRIVASDGARRLVHFLAESGPPEGSEQVRSENSLIGIYSDDSATWEDAQFFINSSYIGRSGGCWTALSVHLFYGDVDGNDRPDIGMLPEQISCESVYDEVDEVDRPDRVHKFGSLQWYLNIGGAQRDERWSMDSAYNGQCPAGGLRYINPPDADGTVIEQALNRRQELDSKDRTVPYCAERAIQNGFYRPAPKLSGDLLEYDYVNFAWGFTRSGVLVDEAGQAFATSMRSPGGDIRDRMRVVGPFIDVRPNEQVAGAFSASRTLDVVTVPEPEEVQCCDLGTGSYVAWRFDASNDTFEEIPLAKEGAHEWQHPDAAANGVTEFLKHVRQLPRRPQ